jgi:hypothetical protein
MANKYVTPYSQDIYTCTRVEKRFFIKVPFISLELISILIIII